MLNNFKKKLVKLVFDFQEYIKYPRIYEKEEI